MLIDIFSSANAGSANFGWNLGGPQAPANVNMPMPPLPCASFDQADQYVASPDEPGVEEYVAAKNAGAMSFAHRIVQWVSSTFVYCILFPTMIHVALPSIVNSLS